MVNSMKWDRYSVGVMKNTAIHILKLIEPMYLYAQFIHHDYNVLDWRTIDTDSLNPIVIQIIAKFV